MSTESHGISGTGALENTRTTWLRKYFPLVLTLAVVLLDQLTKQIIVNNIEPIYENGFVLQVFGDVVRIIHARNPGIAFSIGHSLAPVLRQVLFTVLPLLVLGGLLVYYVRSAEFTQLQRWALAGILGGGLGNLIDRVFRPAGVVDFIDVKFYGLFGMERWPTFNVADTSVVISGILLLVTILFQEGPRQDEQEG